MTDWIEHNGGPQPVADDVWVGVAGLSTSFQAKRLNWTRSRPYRILNQHLIDAARLEGIRLGLEAAAKVPATLSNMCAEGSDPQKSYDYAEEVIRNLNPETIAREAVLDQLTSEAQADNMGYDNGPR